MHLQYRLLPVFPWEVRECEEMVPLGLVGRPWSLREPHRLVHLLPQAGPVLGGLRHDPPLDNRTHLPDLPDVQAWASCLSDGYLCTIARSLERGWKALRQPESWLSEIQKPKHQKPDLFLASVALGEIQNLVRKSPRVVLATRSARKHERRSEPRIAGQSTLNKTDQRTKDKKVHGTIHPEFPVFQAATHGSHRRVIQRR